MHLPAERTWNQSPRRARMEVFLLGQVEWTHCLALQKRLVENCYSRAGGPLTLLICEHPPVITLGRGGSADDIQVRGALYAGRSLDIHPTARGGGAMLHLPGQLAVYPIVSLDAQGWTVGEFVARFARGLQSALAAVGVQAQWRPDRHGLWGRSGALVTLGIGVRDWITFHGAQIHVQPSPPLANYLVIDRAEQHAPPGCLQAETGRAVTMTQLRSRVARSVAESFDCGDYHCHTGHPLLPHLVRDLRVVARAS